MTERLVEALLAVSGELLVTRAAYKRLEFVLIQKGILTSRELAEIADDGDYQQWLSGETRDFTDFTFLRLAEVATSHRRASMVVADDGA